MPPIRTITLICAAVVLLFAAGCSSQPNLPAVVPSVTLHNLEPKVLETGTDKQTVNNCGGTDDATYKVAKEREITRLLEVDSQFSVSADGAVDVFGIRIGLGTAVAARVGATYGKRDTVNREIEIKVEPKTMVEFEVSLRDVFQAGNAEVTVGGQRTTIPFRFFNDFTLVLLSTREIPCEGMPSTVPTDTVALEDGTTPVAPPIELPGLTATPTETATPTPTVTATPGPPTEKLCGETFYQFSLAESLADVTYAFPDGYRVGYISSDPAELELPSGEVQKMPHQFVLIVEDVPVVKLYNVRAGIDDNGKLAPYTYGCAFPAVDPMSPTAAELEANGDYAEKVLNSNPAELYRLTGTGLEQLESNP